MKPANEHTIDSLRDLIMDHELVIGSKDLLLVIEYAG